MPMSWAIETTDNYPAGFKSEAQHTPSGKYLGGWRIVKTMGTNLHTVSGSCVFMGGAIVGSRAPHNVKLVRWEISINLASTWIQTIPAHPVFAATFW